MGKGGGRLGSEGSALPQVSTHPTEQPVGCTVVHRVHTEPSDRKVVEGCTHTRSLSRGCCRGVAQIRRRGVRGT
eukprot:138193-Rhodomonas_salina.1